MVVPIVAPPDPGGQWLEQILIYIIWESFHVKIVTISSLKRVWPLIWTI
jgi:hypothetical protein